MLRFANTLRILSPLALVAATAALTGCPNPQTYGTPRTLDPGKITHTVAVEAWNYQTQPTAPGAQKISGTIPMPPTYQLRVGVHEMIDVGVRLPNLTSVGGDVKFNPVRGKFDLAVQPGLQWFSISSKSSVNGQESSSSVSAYYLHLPVMLGFNFSEAVSLVLTPGVTYTAIGGTASSDGASAAATTKGTWGRFGIGLDLRLSDKFAFHPEVTVMRAFTDEKTMMTFLGLGFNFGRLPNYKELATP